VPKHDLIRRIDLFTRGPNSGSAVVLSESGSGDVWLPLPDGGYFPGDPIGATLEVRRIADLNTDGEPYLDAGGEQQRRVMLAARGQNGVAGVVMLSGTQAEPNTATLLLLADPPASATASGTKGEVRVADGFLYYCVATDVWQRAALATWP